MTPQERERRLLDRERAGAADEAEVKRRLAEADRERARARRLAARFARRARHALGAARARLDADRAAVGAKVAKLNELRSEFHAASAADRDRLQASWADLEARQKRLTADWDEASRFQAQQAAALDARAAELDARERAEAAARARVEREVAALREEAAALDTRASRARAVVDELERRRAELQAATLAGAPGAEPPSELLVALDRAADRDLTRWAAELEEREVRSRRELAATQKERNELADRKRALAEQFAQLAAARALWQEAERATVAEMEQLAASLRRREAELDARDRRVTRADARRREDSYALWQLRLRLEAWQSKIVAYEMRWHAEREEAEYDLARREANLMRRYLPPASAGDEEDAVPLALPVREPPAELAALRDELDRMAAVLLEAELPEPPDPPESELPWAAEDVPDAEPVEADVLPFDPASRAA